jgi:hypothetical protein
MEEFKREHFKATYGMPFPAVRTLSPAEASEVARRLRTLLNLRPDSSPLQLVCALDELEETITDVNAEDSNFALDTILWKSVAPEAKVMINWYRFDEIDEVDFDDLVAFFNNFWYPGADDIDVFDASLSWIISVRHDGTIKRLFTGTTQRSI